MAKTLNAALPLSLDLGGGWVLEWAAVDPTTGAPVAGVVVSDTSLVVAGDTGFLADAPNPILIAVSQ